MIRPTLHLIAACLCLALLADVQAQQSEDFGDFVVHYNTINTDLLPRDVAQAYGIQRSGTRALLNIAILRKADLTPVHARVSAAAVNLSGQRREIGLREITDDGSIYYIGQFRVHNEETLNFDIQVRPKDAEIPPLELAFRQQFFTR